MAVDPNNQFARAARDVQRAVAAASLRLATAQAALNTSGLKGSEVAALKNAIVDEQKTVSDGEAWLKWAPEDA